MWKALVGLILALLITPAVAAIKGYDIFTDVQGDIYLKAHKQFVLIKHNETLPLHVRPKNGLLRVYERDGQWFIEALTEAQWNALNLKEGNSQVKDLQFADLDGDKIPDALLVLHNQFTPYITLSNLTGEASLFGAQGFSMADAMRKYRLVDQDGDGVAEIVAEEEYQVVSRSSFVAMAFATPTALDPGQSPAEFRVDESGAATYTVPLALPEGIAGVKPSLAFQYSSGGAGAGLMGVGWNLSGASMISRCAKNIVNDNLQDKVSFAASDRLCLDGQRLISGAGSTDIGVSDSSYWAATQFHSELDNFALVKPHGSTTQGPKAFTIETKSGEIHYYGDLSYVSGTDTKGGALALSLKNNQGATEAATDALLEVNGTSIPRQWGLKAIRDVKGNYIAFHYAKDNSVGLHYLSDVYYTGRGSQAPHARVELKYKDADKKRYGYVAGQKVTLSKLLEAVTVHNDGQQYRYYQLQYAESKAIENKTHLTTIQECTNDALSLCYPALTFNWTKPATYTGGSNNVCANGLCWDQPTTDNYAPIITSSSTKGISTDRYNHKFFDLNGDGYMDMVYPGASSWKVRFGSATQTYSTETDLGTAVGLTKKEYSQLIDYNGDGIRDLLIASSNTSSWYVVYYQQSAVAACNPVTSSALCPAAAVTATKQVVALNRNAIGLDGLSQVVDYDGDGREDILFVNSGQFQAYRNLGFSAGVHQGYSTAINLGAVATAYSVMDINAHLNKSNLRSAASFDVNGDGRTDLVMKVQEGQCSNIYIDTKQECQYEGFVWTDLTQWKLFVSTGSAYQLKQTLGTIENPRAVDLNGDGYTDLMFQVGTAWQYRLSDGVQLLNARVSSLSTPADRLALTFFVDLNQDGRTDVLYPNTNSSWTYMLSVPVSDHSQVVFDSRGTFSFDANAAIQLGDVDADNQIDLLTSINDSGWRVYKNARSQLNDYSISSFTNSWGVATSVSYSNLVNPSVYYRAASSANTTSDYFSPRSGLYVVSQASTAVNAGKSLTVNYQYGGLLIHKKGRGMLGFEHVRTTDAQSSVVTETKNYQLWPYTGIPEATLQSRSNYLISTATNTVSQLTTAYGGVYPYVSASNEKGYQLSGTVLNTSTQLTNTSSSFVYDTYGNLTSSSVTVTDPQNSANKLLTNTTNTFNASTAYQRYGRLTASTVRKRLYVNNAVTSDISRQSSFSYNTDYLLETEVFAPNLAAAKSTTTYGYDAAGNKTSVKVNAGSGANGATVVDRTSSSSYTSNFRYVASSTDVMGNVSNYKYNGVAAASFTPALITSITATSPNNQSSTTNFDAFGQSTSSSVKGALASDAAVTGTVTKSFCSGCDPLFPDAYIKVVTSSVTGAEQQQFIDKYGREVGSKTKLPVSGSYSVSRKTYDNQGRPSQVFEPHIGSISSYVSTVSYDALGRATQTTMANGGVSKVDYSGYTTTNTDALLKTKSSQSNYLGQTVSTTDHNGSVLSFSYNAYGDLLTASFAGVTRVSNTYDAYGRKTAMTDVDKGSWSYVTNGFGELISQTNAKAQTTVFEYNNAGQMLRRYDPSGTVCWSYGSTAAAYNVNQLIGVKQWTASNTACDSTATPVYSESYLYNSKALVSSKTISTGGASYTTSSTYDSYGRPYELTYPSSGSITGPKIRTDYSYGVAYKTTDYSSGSAGTVYHHTTAVNARGQSTGVTYGNTVTATFSYEDATGWLTDNTVKKGTTTIQSYGYDFDDVGNVTSRQLGYGIGSSANLTETFGYDNLHRLTSRTVNSALNVSGALAMTESYSYDALGNLTSKPGIGNYSFTYDANGNVTNDSKRTFTYTAFEKPSKIQQNTDYTDFEYGPNRELIKRIDKRGSNITTTLMLDGYEQITLPTGVVEHKYSVGDAIITKRSGTPTADAAQVYYLHKDQQGSTTAITNKDGNTVQQLMYDPWGKQYVVNTSLLTYTSPATSKGYTGHEMVNDFEVIHMGGRTYNPVLGRFMQADPFIQAPGNLQSYNRYSYVLNNPMSYTDPSGYFFKKLFSSIAKVPILNAAITAVLAFYCQACLVVYNTLSTYAITGSLRSALVSGIATAAMPGGGSVGRVLASAAIGGLASTLQGGKFGHGFVSAGLGAAFGGVAKGMSNTLSKIVVGAAIGGTLSKISGDKFANGAFSGAFAAALSDNNQDVDSEVKGDMEMAEAIYDDGDGAKKGDTVAGHELVDIREQENGLRAGLFVDASGNAVLSFAGTDTASVSGFLKDLKTNFLQAFGFESAQYSAAKSLAVELQKQYPSLRFVGHSLGGGLAAAAAYTAGGRATLFNAAGLHANTTSGSRYNPQITHYYSGYDGIRVLNTISPVSMPGQQISLGHAGGHGMRAMCRRVGAGSC